MLGVVVSKPEFHYYLGNISFLGDRKNGFGGDRGQYSLERSAAKMPILLVNSIQEARANVNLDLINCAEMIIPRLNQLWNSLPFLFSG